MFFCATAQPYTRLTYDVISPSLFLSFVLNYLYNKIPALEGEENGCDRNYDGKFLLRFSWRYIWGMQYRKLMVAPRIDARTISVPNARISLRQSVLSLFGRITRNAICIKFTRRLPCSQRTQSVNRGNKEQKSKVDVQNRTWRAWHK